MSRVALIRIKLIDQLEIIAVVEFVRGESRPSPAWMLVRSASLTWFGAEVVKL